MPRSSELPPQSSLSVGSRSNRSAPAINSRLLRPVSYSHSSSSSSSSMSNRSPLSSPNRLTSRKPRVRLLPPIDPALVQSNHSSPMERGGAPPAHTSCFSSSSAFTHVGGRVSYSLVDEQTTQTGVKSSKPIPSPMPQLGSSSSTIVSIQSPSSNVSNTSSLLGLSSSSSILSSSTTPPGSNQSRTSPSREPRPVKLSYAPSTNAFHPRVNRPSNVVSLAGDNNVCTSMDLAAAHQLPSVSLKRSAAVADLNLVQPQQKNVMDEDQAQSGATAGEDIENAQLNMDCDSSQPVTCTCYFEPIDAASLPPICPLQLPSTVTQQLPTNGMMELYVPHVLLLPSNFNSPLFVSHGQCWNIGFIRQPARRPAAASSSTRESEDDCLEQLDGFDTPVLDATEAVDFGFCLVLRNECFDSLNLNQPILHALTPPMVHNPQIAYHAEFSCKIGTSCDRSSCCTFLHPPPSPTTSRTTPEHSNDSSSESKSKPAAPTWFVNSASIASGHMFIRPTILFTLIHPSGNAARNRRWMSHPHQIMDFHLNQDIHDGFMHEFDGHLLANAFGISRAISRADLESSEFLDSSGGILLRAEIMPTNSYAWSIPMDTAAPNSEAIHQFHAINYPQLKSNGLHASSVHSHPSTHAHSRRPPIGPDPHYSRSRRTQLHQQHHQQHHQQQQYLNASHSSPSLPSSMNPHPNYPLFSFAETVVTSSHLMMHNYEFHLKLHSQIILYHTANISRFRTFTVSLVLHPRHMYRLIEKDDMSVSVRVDATIQLQPTHCLSPSNETKTTINQQEREQATNNMIQHDFVVLLNAKNPAITLPYQLMSSSSTMRSHGCPTSQSLSNFTDVQVQFYFNSVGIVWNVVSFAALCSCQRKVSPMFRLHDLTWNLIVDPKSVSDPKSVAIYLQLDKTCAGAFCHGLVLVPVFTLTILHPTDSSRHIIRKFDDATFSFDQQIFGCSSFVEQAHLHDNGWYASTPTHSSTGSLQVEVQVLSIKILRPAELNVETPIGPHGFTHAAYSYEEQCQMHQSYDQHKAQKRQPLVLHTHSTPLLQPQQPFIVPPTALSSSSSSTSLSSSSSSPPLNPITSSPYGARSQRLHQQSLPRFNLNANDSLIASSASPVFTPLLDYLGAPVAEEEWDSYALPIQSRRFGADCYDDNSVALKNDGPLYETNSFPPCSPAPPSTESMEVQHQQQQQQMEERIEEQIDSCETRMLSPPPPLELPPSQLSLCDTKRHNLTTTTRHGYICIIRCSQFADSKLPQLIGYEVDEDRLLNTFLHALHCDVEVHLNISGAEVNRVFKVLSMKDFRSYDYLAVFILTHGVDSNTVYAGDGTHIAINDIFTLFRGVECKSLAGKPKLFFVQACRGSAVDYSAREGSGVPNLNPQNLNNNNNSSTPPQLNQQQQQAPPPPASSSQLQQPQPPIEINRANIGSIPLQYTLDFPNESDFLYASSCVPGYISWTNTATGSWYISALCNVLLSYWPHMHLGDILLRVNFAVSKQNKLVDKYGSVYQIAAPTFTLRKKLYLHHAARKQQLQTLNASLRISHNGLNVSSASTNSTTSTHE